MLMQNKNYMLLLTVLLLLFCFNTVQTQPKAIGEPVPGAEVYIEIDPDYDPVSKVTTDENGEFAIIFSNIGSFPQLGTFIFTIKPSKSFAIKHNLVNKKMQKIKVQFDKKKNGALLKNQTLVFKYKLTWDKDVKAQNRGSFAVSGKSEA